MNFKVIVTLWIIIMLWTNFPGKFEASVFPVITDANIIITPHIDKDVDFVQSELFIGFIKLRGYCTYAGTEFYIVKYDDYGNRRVSLLDAKLIGEEKVRTEGRQLAGPWLINTAPENLVNMIVIAKHNCHIGFKTQTRLDRLDGAMVR